jgi:hypothetical protein
MIDLNNPDTYQIQDFGGGNTLYRDSATGQFYDPNDLTVPLSTTDVQQYGAPVNTGSAISTSGSLQTSQSVYGAPAGTSTVSAPGSGGVSLAGLTGMFTALGSAFANKLNPPKTTTGGQPLVYDSVRGTYIPASAAGQSVTNITNIPMWIVIGLVVVALLIVFRKKV